MPPWRPWTVLTEVFIFCLLGLDCEGQKEVKVTRGENATLECYGPSDATDVLLRWTKPEQQIQGYVIYLKDGHFQGHLQDPSFKGRVELKDSKGMNNGNFSVILQNVTMKDSGTYECEAAYNKQAAQLLNNISLRVVVPPGQTGGHTEDGGKEAGSVGLKAGLPVAVIVVAAAVVGVCFFIYKKLKQRNQGSYEPPTEPQIEMSESFLNSESPAAEYNDRNDLEANSCHGHSTRILDV